MNLLRVLFVNRYLTLSSLLVLVAQYPWTLFRSLPSLGWMKSVLVFGVGAGVGAVATYLGYTLWLRPRKQRLLWNPSFLMDQAIRSVFSIIIQAARIEYIHVTSHLQSSDLCWHAQGHLQVISGHCPGGLLVRQRHRHAQDLLLVARHERDGSRSKCGISNEENKFIVLTLRSWWSIASSWDWSLRPASWLW